MKNVLEQSDSEFLNELHRLGAVTVQQIGVAIGVTATAVRQRLVRLQGTGMISRELVRMGRGRPHFVYKVTDKGLRQLGDNYGDLALILWREIRNIADPEVRQAVSNRVRDALVARFGKLGGATLGERLVHLRDALLNRGFDVEVQPGTEMEPGAPVVFPILREINCPYQELADEDRGICELEQEVFQRVLGTDVKLSQCCLDGHHCCEFEVQELTGSQS